MPHTIETTCYKFNELSEDAKQKAIADHYDFNVNHDWWQWTYEDAATIGVKITGFDLGRRRDIDGELTDDIKTVCEKIMKEHSEECDTYKVAKEHLQTYTVWAVTKKLAGSDFETDPSFFEESEYADMEEEFKKDILNAYWKLLYEEYEYLTSDEAISESLISNDYDFEEDGSRF